MVVVVKGFAQPGDWRLKASLTKYIDLAAPGILY
jgi:hypothetical protein